MPLERPSRKKPREEEMITVEIPRSKLRRPFPLIWGIAALALFVAFAVVTQFQFNRINADKIYEARLDTYESDMRAYQVALLAQETCLDTIEVRETYRSIFSGIENMFQTTADLPTQLLPESEVAVEYRETLTADIERYITKPVEEGLPPKKVEDCPGAPTNKPEKP